MMQPVFPILTYMYVRVSVTCLSVISLLIIYVMEITIKIQSHSGVILFLDSKVQPNWKFSRFNKIKRKISLHQFY